MVDANTVNKTVQRDENGRRTQGHSQPSRPSLRLQNARFCSSLLLGHSLYVDASLCEPSLSVVQDEERLSLGVQSRGIAVLRKRTKLDKRGLNEELLFACASRRGTLRGFMRARSRMETAIRNSDHSFPSISHHHRGLHQQHPRLFITLARPAKASSSSFTVRDPLFTCPLSFVPKSTIHFLIHAPYTTGLLITVPAIGRLHTNASLRRTLMASSDDLIGPHATRI